MDQSITFTALGNKTFGDVPFAVNATSDSGLAVSFSVTAGPATINGSTVTITGSGSVTITANQAGNATFNAAASVARSFSVAKADQTITFPALGDKSVGDAPFAVSATSSAGLPVAFNIVSGPATISGNTVSLTGTGVVVVRASQVGNTDYGAASDVDQSFNVAAVTASSVRSLPSNYTAGIAFTVTIQATPSATGVYAVEDSPPTGWNVTAISNSGSFDSVNHKVKWGPFFDNASRTLTYTVTPPAAETGIKTFGGLISIDGNDQAIGGAETVVDGSTGGGGRPAIISNVQRLGTGVFKFTFKFDDNSDIGTGELSQFRIDFSSDLSNWTSAPAPTLLTNGVVTWEDNGTATNTSRFYRLRQVIP